MSQERINPKTGLVEIDPRYVTAVSLHPYRTDGVRVFAGYERGKVVAEAIKEDYGEYVTVEVPEDVLCITTAFKSGFASVLPDVKIPSRHKSEREDAPHG